MKANDTISVNPSKTALGHVENQASSLFRSQVLGVDSQSHGIDIMHLAFPTVKSGLNEYSKYALPFRTIFATILIISGLSLLSVSTSIPVAVCSLVFGALLAIGFLTRPVMLGAAAYFCVMGALSVRSGSPELSLFSLMFGCAIFGVIGAGKYSCDTLLRSYLLRSKKSKERRVKENYMSYKAFHNML